MVHAFTILTPTRKLQRRQSKPTVLTISVSTQVPVRVSFASGLAPLSRSGSTRIRSYLIRVASRFGTIPARPERKSARRAGPKSPPSTLPDSHRRSQHWPHLASLSSQRWNNHWKLCRCKPNQRPAEPWNCQPPPIEVSKLRVTFRKEVFGRRHDRDGIIERFAKLDGQLLCAGCAKFARVQTDTPAAAINISAPAIQAVCNCAA
jgi:hypothetical protein